VPGGDTGNGDRAARLARRGSPRPGRRHRVPHRAEQYDLLILAQWSEPGRTDEHVGWARTAFAALRPHLEDAVYVNNLGTEGPERVRSAYGPNHARLAALKRTYDPANVFRLNQNVPPA
jgi:Berberine and berberine like